VEGTWRGLLSNDVMNELHVAYTSIELYRVAGGKAH
jgi:hypothetical protein